MTLHSVFFLHFFGVEIKAFLFLRIIGCRNHREKRVQIVFIILKLDICDDGICL